MELGEKIQLLRKKKGWSQEELANFLNVSRQSVQKWETDASTPEVDKLVQISDIFGVTLDYLLKNNMEDIKQDEEEQEPIVEPKTESHPETVKTIVYEENGMEEGRITACKVWLIIGTVLTPLSVAGSFLGSVQSPLVLLFLLLYFVTIPLCASAIRAIRTAKRKDEVIGWGVVSLIFISFIGGILILSSRFKTKTKEIASTDDDVVETNSSPEIIQTSTSSLEETKYALLQNHVYKYETGKGMNDLREIIVISKYLADSDYKDSKGIYEKYAPIFSQRERKRENSAKTAIKVIVSLVAVAGVLTAIIVPVSISAENNKKRQHWDDVYNQAVNLINNYDDSNYYKIQSLLNELPYGESYDTTALWHKLNGRHNYEFTVKALGLFYSTKSYTLTEIKRYMDSSESGYKKIDAIKADYANVENYTSTTTSNSSTSAPNYATDGTAESNRNAISCLYKFSNTSGLWNFDYYVKYFSVPYIISGAEFSNGTYNFKWYHDSSGGRLIWNVPTLSVYDSSIAYYFYTSFTGSGYISYSSGSSSERYSNQMKFYLKPQTGSASSVDLFRVDEIGYNKNSDKFYCKVYLFATGQTLTFTQE